MSGINSDATVAGSGYGYGYGGGGWGGIAPVGLFGLIGADGLGRHHDGGRDRGHGHDCNDKLLQMFADGVNEKFTTLSANIDKGQLQSDIHDVEESVRETGQNARTAFEMFALGTERNFGDLKAGQKELAYRGELDTKDIISSQKDCCREIQGAIKDEGSKTREMIAALDKQALERAFRDCKDESIILRGKLDNDKQTHHLEHYMQTLLGRMDRQEDRIGNIGNIVLGLGNTVGNSSNNGVKL